MLRLIELMYSKGKGEKEQGFYSHESQDLELAQRAIFKMCSCPSVFLLRGLSVSQSDVLG